jgi:uncharacterized protein with GYD domain
VRVVLTIISPILPVLLTNVDILGKAYVLLEASIRCEPPPLLPVSWECWSTGTFSQPTTSPNASMISYARAPIYIVLIKLTEFAIKNIKDLPQRDQRGRVVVEKAGGKWLDWNLTMGEYDTGVKVEMPDDSTAAAVLLAIGQ